MVAEIQNVLLIYTETDSGTAEEIRAYLARKLAESHKIREKAAVVLISDAAEDDREGWLAEVAALGEDVRLIPVGRTENASYSKQVPDRIREINYIRRDEAMLENILDSILIDADFYRMRSEVVLQINSWEASGRSDAFLMTEGRTIRRYRRMTAEKAATETDPRFQAQLREMEAYLDVSRKHARKIFFHQLRRALAVGLTAALFIFFAVAARYLIRTMQRANREAALLGVPQNEANAAENVILLCDGIINPTIDWQVREAFVRELTSYLDLNWCTTPIGFNYKHTLTSAMLLPDGRHLATTVSNGKLAFWDTYTGRIREENQLSSVPLKAFHIDPETNLIVVVTEENIVQYGIGTKWLTNNTPQYFSENTPIRIDTSRDHVLLYDDRFLYHLAWSEEGPTVTPLSYIADETMAEDYEISSAALTDTGYLAAMKYGETLYLIDSEGTDYNMEIVPSATCNSVILGDRLIFADAEGNLMLFDRENITLDPVGLRLPDPRFLCFVDETTIVYHDALLGTHVYDIAQHIELGELFSSFGELDGLAISGTSAVCLKDGLYTCQPFASLLPRTELDPAAVLVTDTDSAEGDGQVRRVAPSGDGTVTVELLAGGEVQEIAISLSGAVTTAGIIDDGHGIVIGTEDGSFQELVFRDNGTRIPCANMRVPSHSAIHEIWMTGENYYLLDEAGNYWLARLGYAGTEDPDLMLDQISGMMHRGVEQELLDSISRETIDSLGLTVMPGGDGKEWE